MVTAKKETQKAKIERLENENNTYKQLIEKLNNEITEIIDRSDNEFENSGTYKQMLAEIEFLKDKNKNLEYQLKSQSQYIEELNNKNHKLKNETIKELMSRIELLEKNNEKLQKLINEKKHNERGAGRKTKFTPQDIEIIKMHRMQGKTIKELAKMYCCSVGLIHKLTKS